MTEDDPTDDRRTQRERMLHLPCNVVAVGVPARITRSL